MSEIIVCVALKSESNQLFEEVIARNSKKDLVHLVYTHVGKINAVYFLTKKIDELKLQNKTIRMIVNLGTAGGKKIKRGSIVVCNKFIQRDFDHTLLGFKHGVNFSSCENEKQKSECCELILEHKNVIQDMANVICGTGDNFETLENCHSSKIPELEQSVQDMEAYALALVCKYENLDFIAIKYVSDEILNEDNDQGQNKQFESALSSAAEKLAEVLGRVLSSI